MSEEKIRDVILSLILTLFVSAFIILYDMIQVMNGYPSFLK